ncbi:hypothetical protein J3Q64DRAFT_1725341 [Phycomyces blakesleeanus]
MLCPDQKYPCAINSGTTPHYNRRTNISRHASRNYSKEIPIFNGPQHESSFDLNSVFHSLHHTSNPQSVLFNVRKLISINGLKEILITQLGAVDAFTAKYTKTRDLIAEVLFVDPAIRLKAIKLGITVQNTPIPALPVFGSGSPLMKIDMFGIPNCHPETDLKDSLIEAIAPFGKVVYICVYRDQYEIFCGRASAYLDTSALQTPPPLRRFIDLGKPFGASIELHAKELPIFCRYCKKDGHTVSECIRLQNKLTKDQLVKKTSQNKEYDTSPSYPLAKEVETTLTENITNSIKDRKSNADITTAEEDMIKMKGAFDKKISSMKAAEPTLEPIITTMPANHRRDNDLDLLEVQIAELINSNRNVPQAPLKQDLQFLKHSHPSSYEYPGFSHGCQDYIESRIGLDIPDICEKKCCTKDFCEPSEANPYFQKNNHEMSI